MKLLSDPAPHRDRASNAAPGGGRGFGCLESAAGLFPMRALVVDTAIVGLDYRSTVTQRFVNTHDRVLEATYVFPLPARAGAVGCRMRVGEREIVAELKERAAAREAYQQALRDGHRAALTEEDRPECFSVTLGNLAPGDVITIELELVGQLAWDEGEACYRFPLVVAPRYIPGTPLPLGQVGGGQALDTDLVPDASRISPPVLLPGFPNPVQLAVDLRIDAAGLPFGDARCNLPCRVVSAGDERLHLRLEPGQALDRDLLLRLPLASAGAEGGSALFLPDADDPGQGTLALSLVPAREPGARAARDVVLLLDRSGSMGGWKMVAARRAVARLVESLDARDRVQVLAFDDRVEDGPLGAALVAADDEARYRSATWLAAIEARGGTELAAPLERAARTLSGEGDGRERAIVLVTDGQVGNEDHLLRLMGTRAAGVRIHCVGIDRAVNAGFLERLADRHGGCCELVESEERLDAVLDRVRARIGRPAFTDARVETAGCALRELAPQRHADAWPGKPWIVHARCAAPADDAAIQVVARGADGGERRIRLPLRHSEHAGLGAVWARSRLRDLEDEFTTRPERQRELEREIVALSLRHGVLCRFTAWIAVDRAAVVDAGGGRLAVTQAVDLPDGWGADAAMPAAPAAGGWDGVMAYECAAMPEPSPAVRRSRRIAAPTSKLMTQAPQRGRGGSRRGGGLLGRLFGHAGSGGDGEDPSVRVTRLIDRLDACGDGRLIALLGELLAEMTALVDAVEQRGAEVASLRRTLERIRQHVAADDPAAARGDCVALVAGLRAALAAGG